MKLNSKLIIIMLSLLVLTMLTLFTLNQFAQNDLVSEIQESSQEISKAVQMSIEDLTSETETSRLNEYLNKALAASTEFMKPMQELVTENCWGTIWTREGLPRKTRSLVTLAFLSALRATTELRTHVLGALRNGCTVQEIQEVLLQASVYVGVPAGIEAFRAAKEVIDTWKE